MGTVHSMYVKYSEGVLVATEIAFNLGPPSCECFKVDKITLSDFTPFSLKDLFVKKGFSQVNAIFQPGPFHLGRSKP